MHKQLLLPTRWWRAVLENARLIAARAAAEAQQAALEQSAAVSLQAFFRGHRDRAALHREAVAAVVIQAFVRGISGRASATNRKASVVRVQAFARSAVAAARYRESRAAATVMQARWRGAVARVLLAAEAKMRAAVAAEIQAAREETSARTLQAFARGVLKRAELERAKAAAVAVQGAWRRKQARMREERSREIARAAVAVQAWWRMAVARAKCRRARYVRRMTCEIESTTVYLWVGRSIVCVVFCKPWLALLLS